MYSFTLKDHNHATLAEIRVSQSKGLEGFMQELFWMLEDFMNGNDVIDDIEADFTVNATTEGKWFYHMSVGKGFNLVGEIY